MLGQNQRKTNRNPLVQLVVSLGSFILVLLLAATVCFLLCSGLFLLNGGTLSFG